MYTIHPGGRRKSTRLSGSIPAHLMRAPLFNNEKTYGAIEVVNNMFSNEFDENNPAIVRVNARRHSQTLQEAEDITLLEGENFE